ncbi:hypothetical protein EYF80_038135 [Liparis tanakae]|uniref:Uncharacterized protein n=1 Tax=Liparis tanakae TaxID=230148 RepID=A0A4Z2GES6_9TELE|nr:hypothetical protein EYF80_038135 [Liparis tanakae]
MELFGWRSKRRGWQRVYSSNGKREAGSYNSQRESPGGSSTIAGRAAVVDNDLQEQWECGRASQQAAYLQQSANTEPLKGWYLPGPAELSGDHCPSLSYKGPSSLGRPSRARLGSRRSVSVSRKAAKRAVRHRWHDPSGTRLTFLLTSKQTGAGAAAARGSTQGAGGLITVFLTKAAEETLAFLDLPSITHTAASPCVYSKLCWSRLPCCWTPDLLDVQAMAPPDTTGMQLKLLL